MISCKLNFGIVIEYIQETYSMKKIKFLLLILGFVFLTSCETMYPVYTTSTIDVNFGTYDYNRINYLYVNNYNYFYTTRYVNQYGVSCYLYDHPYFIRYQNDYYRKHNKHIPHYNYNTIRTHRNETNTAIYKTTSVQRNQYIEPRRTNVQYKPTVVHKTTPTVRRTPQRTSAREPIHNQVRRNIQTTTNRRRN
jgi:hypothetical protein